MQVRDQLVDMAGEQRALHVFASGETATNEALVAAIRSLGIESELIQPDRVTRVVRRDDVVLGRIDVLADLTGVEPGFWELRRLARRGVRVLNGHAALLCAHDKLQTALRLGRAGVRHPRTVHLDGGRPSPALEPPLVLKPRFGSWGRDVVRCESTFEIARALDLLSSRRWFRDHGVIAQQLISPRGRDLRLLVAGGEIAGAVARLAAPGEWRTNVALGASRHSVVPPDDACRLALAAAAACDLDLVGVDLLPCDDGWVVLELNGAVDFTPDYALADREPFAACAAALVRIAGHATRAPASARKRDSRVAADVLASALAG